MQFFLHSRDSAVITELAAAGRIDGALLPPDDAADLIKTAEEIGAAFGGPVCLPLIPDSAQAMEEAARRLTARLDGGCPILPMGAEGLTACRSLSEAGIWACMAPCLSLSQAVLAARAGAAYIIVPMQGAQSGALLEAIRAGFETYDLPTQIIAALTDAAQTDTAITAGADIALLPAEALDALTAAPQGGNSQAAFFRRPEKTGQIPD